MKNRIITISREFGSGGRTVGKIAAQKLGVPCYDQELIREIAGQSGFTEDYVAEQSECTRHGNWIANAFSEGSLGGFSNQDYLWIVQRKVILKLAQEESCVIVGRCADYILGKEADCLRVFIHADPAKRAERIVKVYGETGELPEKRVRDKDRRRAAYYQFYTDMKWGEARNYHIALDSGALGIEKCAELITSLY